jgi:hypothetical protein
MDVVIIEDILEDKEDLPPVQEQHAARINEIADFNPLAIIPYVPPAFPFIIKMTEQIPPPVSAAVPVSEPVNEQNPKRRLNFDDDSHGVMDTLSVTVPVSAQNATATLKKLPKQTKATPETEAAVRRSTRQSAKKDGFKLEPMRDKITPPRKKAKSAKPRMPKPGTAVPPPTPVPTLQKVGEHLEIPSEDMTLEKLMAAPVEDQEKNVANE